MGDAIASKFSSRDIIDMLRNKYGGGAYCVLEQVADGTGAGTSSWIDAVVFSLWPSNGIWRGAYEVKVSRSDFLRELSKPAKNEWAREHFDYFWYVTASGVAKDDEIPTGCGLMVARSNGLSVVKQAPRREGVKTDNSLIASFARSLDKERERFVRDGLRKAMQEDHQYQESLYWKVGGERYLKHCDTYCYPHSADEVFDALFKAAKENSPESVEAEHMQAVLGNFSDAICRFLLQVAPLAAHALNARDETAEFIMRRYGIDDKCAIEALRKVLKKGGKKADRRGKENANREVAVRDALNDSGDAA